MVAVLQFRPSAKEKDFFFLEKLNIYISYRFSLRLMSRIYLQTICELPNVTVTLIFTQMCIHLILFSDSARIHVESLQQIYIFKRLSGFFVSVSTTLVLDLCD